MRHLWRGDAEGALRCSARDSVEEETSDIRSHQTEGEGRGGRGFEPSAGPRRLQLAQGRTLAALSARARKHESAFPPRRVLRIAATQRQLVSRRTSASWMFSDPSASGPPRPYGPRAWESVTEEQRGACARVRGSARDAAALSASDGAREIRDLPFLGLPVCLQARIMAAVQKTLDGGFQILRHLGDLTGDWRGNGRVDSYVSTGSEGLKSPRLPATQASCGDQILFSGFPRCTRGGLRSAANRGRAKNLSGGS